VTVTAAVCGTSVGVADSGAMVREPSAFWKRTEIAWSGSGPPCAMTLPGPMSATPSSAVWTTPAGASKRMPPVVPMLSVPGSVKVSVKVPLVGLPVVESHWGIESRMPDSRSRATAGTAGGTSSPVGVRICRFGFRAAQTSSRNRESWIGWMPKTARVACSATSAGGGPGGGVMRSASCRNTVSLPCYRVGAW